MQVLQVVVFAASSMLGGDPKEEVPFDAGLTGNAPGLCSGGGGAPRAAVQLLKVLLTAVCISARALCMPGGKIGCGTGVPSASVTAREVPVNDLSVCPSNDPPITLPSLVTSVASRTALTID